MSKQKGAVKLRRSGKHAGMYAAQFLRTARNKQKVAARRERRKVLMHKGYKVPKQHLKLTGNMVVVPMYGDQASPELDQTVVITDDPK
jgi:hypothetical protein